jgi:hypothetical protein
MRDEIEKILETNLAWIDQNINAWTKGYSDTETYTLSGGEPFSGADLKLYALEDLTNIIENFCHYYIGEPQDLDTEIEDIVNKFFDKLQIVAI